MKVLLRERKRHTARSVSSTQYAVLSWGGGGYLIPGWGGGVPHLGVPLSCPDLARGYPCPDLARGYPISGYPLPHPDLPRGGGTSSQGTPHPDLTRNGVPIPPSRSGVPPEGNWDQSVGYPLGRDLGPVTGVPPGKDMRPVEV